MPALRHAFKEWAGICRALADGRQGLGLRKGGIAEAGGTFQVEHTRFWLYPTYVHQQEGGVRDEARDLLAEVQAQRPPAGVVRLTHWAEVAGVYHVHDIASVLKLGDLHFWTQETAQAR